MVTQDRTEEGRRKGKGEVGERKTRDEWQIMYCEGEEFMMGTWYVDLCADSPATAPEILLATS